MRTTNSQKHIRHTQELHPRSISLLRPLKYLRSPPKPFKSLKLQVNLALKRLASAVQLRPWPPSFQSLTTNRVASALPQKATLADHKLTKGAGAFASNSSAKPSVEPTAESGNDNLEECRFFAEAP